MNKKLYVFTKRIYILRSSRLKSTVKVAAWRDMNAVFELDALVMVLKEGKSKMKLTICHSRVLLGNALHRHELRDS